MNAQEPNAHLLREIRSLREQLYNAIDTARSLLYNHSAQLELINQRLEKLETELGANL